MAAATQVSPYTLGDFFLSRANGLSLPKTIDQKMQAVFKEVAQVCPPLMRDQDPPQVLLTNRNCKELNALLELRSFFPNTDQRAIEDLPVTDIPAIVKTIQLHFTRKFRGVDNLPELFDKALCADSMFTVQYLLKHRTIEDLGMRDPSRLKRILYLLSVNDNPEMLEAVFKVVSFDLLAEHFNAFITDIGHRYSIKILSWMIKNPHLSHFDKANPEVLKALLTHVLQCHTLDVLNAIEADRPEVVLKVVFTVLSFDLVKDLFDTFLAGIGRNNSKAILTWMIENPQLSHFDQASPKALERMLQAALDSDSRDVLDIMREHPNSRFDAVTNEELKRKVRERDEPGCVLC